MVERKIIWSPRAKQDLLEILDFYNTRNGNKAYSIKLNAIIQKSIRKLRTQSQIGRNSDIKHIKCLIISDFCVFYEVRPNLIEIVTIWNSNQDPDKLKIQH